MLLLFKCDIILNTLIFFSFFLYHTIFFITLESGDCKHIISFFQNQAKKSRHWLAPEFADTSDCNSAYTIESEVFVSGLLSFFILSGGHHPFGAANTCRANIAAYKPQVNRQHLEDPLALDLILTWMLPLDPVARKGIDQCIR